MGPLEKPRLLHLITSFGNGGAELALPTLVANGFYTPFDARIVSLMQGEGSTYDNLKRQLGDGVKTLMPASMQIKNIAALSLLAHAIHREFKDFKPSTVILSLPHATFLGRVISMWHPGIKVATFEHNTSHPRRRVALAMHATASRNDVVLGDTSNTLASARNFYALGRKLPSFEVPLFIADTGIAKAS